MVQTVHTRRSQVLAPEISGGCQLALDMSTAFDRVPRWALSEALQWAGADSRLIAVILDLHNGCQYHIKHGPYVGRVRMGRGVRQGCTLAPLLRCIFSTYLLHVIGERTSHEWVRHFVTVCADDAHACWVLRKARNILDMRACIRSSSTRTRTMV